MEPLEEAAPEGLAPAEIEAAVSVARRIATNIRRAVEVREEVLEHVTVALLAEGHILVEDYPGVGKTALARAVSRSIDCAFARVQCTADLLPADIVGTNVYNQREQRFEFRPGPIFANVVIVDEVNRASPKTQSGLLECMQERMVTVDVHSHELARPFLVFATQNPVEYEGTYPLPEAQVDRFMVRLSLGYPNAEEEAGMLAGHESRDRVLDLLAVTDRAEILEAVETAHRVHASRALRDYIVALMRHTRADGRVELGASPRAGLMLLRAAKARALLRGRDHALPDDVQELANVVLAQAVQLGLGGRDQRHPRVRRRGVAAAGGGAHRQHARQHQQLVADGAGDDALGEPERVAEHERGRREPAAPAAAERDLDAYARRPAAGAEAHGLGQQRLLDPAWRQREAAGRGPDEDLQRLLLEHAACPQLTADRRAPRAGADPARRAEAQQRERRAGDVQRLGVERAGDDQQQEPESRAPERRPHGR